MLRYGKEALYLEPGEIAVLANLARRAVPPGAPTHPNSLLLQALGKALADLVDGPGVMLAPAPPSAVRQAAQAYVKSGAVATANPNRPSGSQSVRPA